MGISRRNLIILYLISFVLPYRVFASETLLMLRPPGARAEEEFLSRCNRCQRCVQVCPTKIILPASFNYGIVNANTPIISYARGYCNSCLKCSYVCPSKALEPVNEATLDIGVASIIDECCVAWDWEGCRVCVDKCPFKAIYLDESKRPVVIREKCNGCGVCHFVCPSTSLRTSIKGKGIIIKKRDVKLSDSERDVVRDRTVAYPILRGKKYD